MVSTFPPTPCGIATFAAALCGGLAAGGAHVDGVRVGGAGIRPGGCVVADLDDRRSPATEALAAADVVIVQHEYGIYAGPDGESIVDVVTEIAPPTIVVAHTVLGAPTRHQRRVLEAVSHAADAVVVMTEAGRARLCAGFDVDAAKVLVIPHGAAVSAAAPRTVPGGRPMLLTWGLLGPGKGIEWAIDAMVQLTDLTPFPRYRIAGDTHPKVAAAHGEAYRDMLKDRAARAGIATDVEFDAGYRNLDDLARMVGEAAVVVLPYDSPDQVTSGVLVDAVAAGRPVVATAFPHAQELLASGAGAVVPRCDPGALAHVLRGLLAEPARLERMAAEARRLAPSLAWPAVAGQYSTLAEGLRSRRALVSS